MVPDVMYRPALRCRYRGQVRRAIDAAPCDGIRVDLDPKKIAAFVLEMRMPLPSDLANAPAVTVERADDTMLDVFVRLLRMLVRPRDLPVPGRLLEQELICHLVSAPGEAINWIRTYHNEPLSIDTLARTVHMSPSVLHRRFKTATVMSPLQYQKQVTLLEARKILMSSDANAASVAYEVSYESPSQFSREYRRLFGASPLKDAGQLRRQQAAWGPWSIFRYG